MQMKIKDLGLPINLKKDKEFEKTRSALDELVNNLIADGHDPPRRSAAIVTSEMEAELYEKGVLGDWNPYILLQTVYFIIGVWNELVSSPIFQILKRFDRVTKKHERLSL